MANFLGPIQLFFQSGLTSLQLLMQSRKVSGSLPGILANIPFFLFRFSYPMDLRWHLIRVLSCILLGTIAIEHVSCAYCPFAYLLWGNVYSTPTA